MQCEQLAKQIHPPLGKRLARLFALNGSLSIRLPLIRDSARDLSFRIWFNTQEFCRQSRLAAGSGTNRRPPPETAGCQPIPASGESHGDPHDRNGGAFCQIGGMVAIGPRFRRQRNATQAASILWKGIKRPLSEGELEKNHANPRCSRRMAMVNARSRRPLDDGRSFA